MSSVKPNSVLLGAPAANFKDTMRQYSIIRNLPKMREELIDLQKRVKSIETKEEQS
jgi:UDP-3-O-[3-hydroxymyristoyl] glucosamine N-acyltransferase